MKKVFFLSIICLMALTIHSGCTEGEYVDLGLPSGTKWKTTNEINPNVTNDLYTYDEAIQKFGNQLPTSKQWMELKTECDWSWNDIKKGYEVTGPNGKSIFMPAEGFRGCRGEVSPGGSSGYYWSYTSIGSDGAKILEFGPYMVYISISYRCFGHSVRLVHDQD